MFFVFLKGTHKFVELDGGAARPPTMMAVPSGRIWSVTYQQQARPSRRGGGRWGCKGRGCGFCGGRRGRRRCGGGCRRRGIRRRSTRCWRGGRGWGLWSETLFLFLIRREEDDDERIESGRLLQLFVCLLGIWDSRRIRSLLTRLKKRVSDININWQSYELWSLELPSCIPVPTNLHDFMQDLSSGLFGCRNWP